ncbi:hypothetical protein B0H16DRAFT_1741364 [Mycena metata]|uniref:Transmembrane protein n=1 Tax=Mycena metata TaxID=1033252 RepID=A0AAD7MGA3_9AGAR|nr:hypothetical protein B0H16DRAFT_1741364 [Mycena metata]
MPTPRQRNSPPLDESDPKSVARYKMVFLLHLQLPVRHFVLFFLTFLILAWRNAAMRNRKTRERMARVRAAQALDPTHIKEQHLEAKRAAQKRYRDKNRTLLARKARDRRNGRACREESARQIAKRRATQEDTLLENAIVNLEPENGEGLDFDSDSDDSTYAGSDDNKDA